MRIPLLLLLVSALILAVTATAAPRSEAPRSRRGAPATPHVRLAFTGDVAMNWRGTSQHLKVFPWKKNPLRFFAPVFKRADLAIANMEGVLMRHDPKYADQKLNLWAPWASGQIFKPAGIGLVGTANNHAFDGRDVGVLETLRHLKKTGVHVMGTGPTEADARRPFLFRKGPACVAFVPGTTKSNKGVRGRARVAFYPPRRQPELLERVRQTRKRCAFVVVYLHWGTEKLHVPKRKIRAFGHQLIQAGASLVVGHHPHVLEGVEFRPGGVIVYSLGNFVFSNPTAPTRRTGVLWVELTKEAQPRLKRLELLPAQIYRRDYTPRPATRPQAEDLLRRMQRYCRPFGTQVVLHHGRLRFLGASRDILPP